MKVSGKDIAKANLSKRASNLKEGKEAGEGIEKEIEDRGSHIAHMFSFIEAIHAKDADSAHKHMVNYANSMSSK